MSGKGLSVVLAFVVGVLGLGQSVVVVPHDYASVAEAVRAVPSGGVIEILPGTYRENTMFVMKSVTLRGMGDSAGDVVLIPANTATPLISATSFFSRIELKVENLTISGGAGDGTVGLSLAGRMTFSNCRFVDNCTAVQVKGSCVVEISDCAFLNNGTGVEATDSSEVRVWQSEFTANADHGLHFGGVSRFEVSNCRFASIYGPEDHVENTAGVSVFGRSTGDVVDCHFIGTDHPERYNPGPGGYYPIANGIQITDEAVLRVAGSSFKYLRAGVMIWGGSEVLIEGNTAEDCCHTAFRLWLPSNTKVRIIGNRVGAFGARPIWCCGLLEAFGAISHPITISENLIGDTGGCTAFWFRSSSCHVPHPLLEMKPEWYFVGTVTGHGNVLTEHYRNRSFECPPLGSDFWPVGFFRN